MSPNLEQNSNFYTNIHIISLDVIANGWAKCEKLALSKLAAEVRNSEPLWVFHTKQYKEKGNTL